MVHGLLREIGDAAGPPEEDILASARRRTHLPLLLLHLHPQPPRSGRDPKKTQTKQPGYIKDREKPGKKKSKGGGGGNLTGDGLAADSRTVAETWRRRSKGRERRRRKEWSRGRLMTLGLESTGLSSASKEIHGLNPIWIQKSETKNQSNPNRFHLHPNQSSPLNSSIQFHPSQAHPKMKPIHWAHFNPAHWQA